MAKIDGSVRINTLVDTQGFGKGMNTMQKQIGGLSGAIGKLGLAITAAFGIGKLIQFGKEAIELGSDLQEVQNVVDVTFRTMSDKVNEFARNAAEAAGLSETMAKRYMGTFGAMASSFGFMEEDAFNMSASLTQAVGDVASFYNLTQDEAYTKLKSVFTGETESLKDLGVVMTQSALDAYAMANGYEKTTSAMSEQEKVALRYSFVLDQLSASSGDFVRTSDSWANQMRILNLSLDTFKANIGQALINVFTPFLKIINQLFTRMADLSASFVAFSQLITGRGASGGGSPGDALGDIASGYDDVTDATNEAAKAQKNYTNGLDELNVLSKDSSASSGGAGGFGISGNEIFEEIANDEELDGPLVHLADRIKAIFADKNWTGLGKLMSDGIILGLNTLSDNIKNIDWNGIGKKIGQFLKDVDWAGIIVSVGNFLETLIDSAIELWEGAFDANPIATAIVSALAIAHFTGLSDVLKSKISTALPAKLSLGKTILIAGITFELGFEVGKEIGKLLFPEDAEWYDNFTWFGEDGFFEALGYWWNEMVYPKLQEFTDYLFSGEWLDAIGESFVENVFNQDRTFQLADDTAYLFTDKIKDDFAKGDWGAIGMDILLGIAGGIMTAISAVWSPIEGIFLWIWDGICAVFGIHSPAKEMEPLGEYIFLGILEGFESMFSEFTTSITTFWNEKVKPWFSKEKWHGLLSPIQGVFGNAFKGAANIVIGFVNKILSVIETMVNGAISLLSEMVGAINVIPGVDVTMSAPQITIPKIPMLASGAVIPPNAPFMAMLGDQKHGTNLEAPEDLIRQIVREEAGSNGLLIPYLEELIKYSKETAEKDLIIGDRDIAKANARGQRSMGYALIEG